MTTCGHPCDCPSYREHLLSISVAPSAMPSRNPEAVRINAKEAAWQRDMPAYKVLREQGVQPKAIDGAADLAARAETKMEVESGHLLPTRAQRETASEVLAEMAG